MKTYTHESGITVKGNHPFIDTFIKVSEDYKKQKDKWIKHLMTLGYKAAHPDDGWNDRQNKEVILCYPYYDLGIEIGDKIVLGDPDNWHSVKIVDITSGRCGLTYYKYA